jgi:hypothetical protein
VKEQSRPVPKASYDFELNWYDFETRTRKLVFELLQPSIFRAAEDREVLFKQNRALENHQSRLVEIEYALFSSEKPQTTIFEKIDERIVEIENQRRKG